jgi:hypothetical protein
VKLSDDVFGSYVVKVDLGLRQDLVLVRVVAADQLLDVKPVHELVLAAVPGELVDAVKKLRLKIFFISTFIFFKKIVLKTLG